MDPIPAITAAAPKDLAQQFQDHDEQSRLQVILSSAPGASLAPLVPVKVNELPGMDLPSIGHMLTNAMHDGFYVAQDRKLVEALSAGVLSDYELNKAMMDINERHGLALFAEKLSTKVAEALQSVVMKQG